MYKVNKHGIQGVISSYNSIELFLVLLKRNIYSRFIKKSKLMLFFLIFKPLIQIIIYTLVFTYLAKIDVPNYPYVLIILSGLFFWIPFVSLTLDISTCLEKNSGMLDRIYIPKNILFLSYMGTGFLELLILIIYFIFINYYYFETFLFQQLLIIFPILFFLLFSYIFGSCCAIFAAIRRDFHHIVTLFMQIFFFTTPILYNFSLIPDKLKILIFLNPLAGIIEFGRWCLLQNYSLELNYIFLSFISLIVCLIIFNLIYKKYNIQINEIL